MYEINPQMRTFLPENASLEGYIDITTVGQAWRVYFNPGAGHTIDGNALYAAFCDDRAKNALIDAEILAGQHIRK